MSSARSLRAHLRDALPQIYFIPLAPGPASLEFSIARWEKRVKPSSEALEEGWFFLRHAFEFL